MSSRVEGVPIRKSGQRTENAGLGRATLAGVFLVSLSLLALEIVATRLYSVVFHYHYAFLIVSLAFAGLGLGAFLVGMLSWTPLRSRADGISVTFVSGLLCLSVLVLFIVAVAFGGSFVSPSTLPAYGMALFLPFSFGWILLAVIFRAFASGASKLYAVDLAGAACGCVGAVGMLNVAGAVNSLLLIGAVTAVAWLLFASRGQLSLRRVGLPSLSLLTMSALFIAGASGLTSFEIAIGTDTSKGSYAALHESQYEGQVVETRWSSFGRTDLVAFRGMADVMAIFVDGDAGTPMYRFGGDFSNPDPGVKRLEIEFTGYLALQNVAAEQRKTALIIGPGGGRDILVAKLAGVKDITAVEVNKDLVGIVREHASYNGGVYDLDGVRLVEDEGRSFLKRQSGRYDIIMLSLPVLGTSRSPEGFALVENFLFTKNSIRDYLDHITDEGRLVVVGHNPNMIMKLVSTTLSALESEGIDNRTAMRQVAVVGSEIYPTFVLKKTPFGPDETAAIDKEIRTLGFDTGLSYLPGGKGESFSPALMAVADGRADFADIAAAYRKHGIDFSPGTDDRPFFYQIETGTPGTVLAVSWSAFSLLMIAIAAYFIFGQRATAGSRVANPPGFRTLAGFAAYFSLIGAGFMMVEISTFQRFTMLLGQPILSLTVLLASLLLFTGIGSMTSGRVAIAKLTGTIGYVAAAVAGLIVALAFAQPTMVRGLIGFGLPIRVFAAFATMAVLGFLMGFLFPLALRLLKTSSLDGHIPWMWGINGVASVLGSAPTLALAMRWGFTAALLLAAACYLAVFLISRNLQPEGHGAIRPRALS